MSRASAPCPICSSTAEDLAGNLDWNDWRCVLCGEFRYDHHCPKPTKLSEVALVRGWLAEQNRLGDRPHFRTDLYKRVSAMRAPTVPERADMLLLHALRRQAKIAEMFGRSDRSLIGATYSIDESEVHYLFDLLAKSGFIQVDGSFANASVTLMGHKHAATIGASGSGSTQGFVAMWFAPEMRPTYDIGFAEGIRRAGYKPIRVDGVEHLGKIDDEIIAQIRKSRFVVADFTGQRGGVYFEAGFALGLGLPVVWTCRRDEVAKLHFDIRQFNCIDWVEPTDLAARLQTRIEASIGVGQLV